MLAFLVAGLPAVFLAHVSRFPFLLERCGPSRSVGACSAATDRRRSVRSPSHQSVSLPLLLRRRDASQLVEEIKDERKVVVPDCLAFGRRSYCDPHAIRVQSVDALN
jgi:hypothetical protein